MNTWSSQLQLSNTQRSSLLLLFSLGLLQWKLDHRPPRPTPKLNIHCYFFGFHLDFSSKILIIAYLGFHLDCSHEYFLVAHPFFFILYRDFHGWVSSYLSYQVINYILMLFVSAFFTQPRSKSKYNVLFGPPQHILHVGQFYTYINRSKPAFLPHSVS